MDSRYDAVIQRHTNEIIARLDSVDMGDITTHWHNGHALRAIIRGAQPCLTCRASGIGDVVKYGPKDDPEWDIDPCKACDGKGYLGEEGTA